MLIEFFDMLDKVLANEVCADSRQSDEGNYFYRFVSLRHIIDQTSSLLPPNFPAPSEIYLSLQLTANNSRAEANDRYYNRFNIKRKCQSHTLVKENKDTTILVLNIVLLGVERRRKNHIFGIISHRTIRIK